MKRNTVLIVDDEEINRLLLAEIFKNAYKVLEAENGMQAIEVLKTAYEEIATILLDIEMPEMNGFQFLDKISALPEAEDIPVIMITADDSNEAQIRAFDRGVSDIIKKPCHPRVVLKRVKNVSALFEYKERLEEMVAEQTLRIAKQTETLKHVNENLIDSLSSVVEFRDLETGEHTQRIKDYTRVMCDVMMKNYPECGLTEHSSALVVSAAAMHDIGKISIPDAILLKPGKLDHEEFEIIKTHTTKGARFLDRVNFISDTEYLEYCKNIALYHHEKYDGKGYPEGLKGEEIPIEAQIVSIADVFDALVSKRVYKDAFSVEEAKNMIVNGECGQYSERILDCFDKSFVSFKWIALESFKRENTASVK